MTISEVRQQQRSTCVVITSYEPDSLNARELVRSVATDMGLSVLAVDEELAAGQSITDAVIDAIRSADIVIAILGSSANPNVFFELGVAMAIGRPVVLVQASPDASIPSTLFSTLSVGPIVSRKAIELAIRRAQRVPQQAPIDVSQNASTGLPLGYKADELLTQLRDLSGIEKKGSLTQGRHSYLYFEDWFAMLLEAAQVPFERAKRVPALGRPEAEIDYVVTADELRGNLGNLLPIELLTGRGRRTFETLRSRLKSFRKYFQATGAETVLVVVLHFEEPPQLMSAWDGSILLTSAADLVDWMRIRTFGNAVISLRNAAIHRGDEW